MSSDKEIKALNDIWKELYPGMSENKLNKFINELKEIKLKQNLKPNEPEWYKDAIVYSLYVDLFNKDFSGLEAKLDYLNNLGVNCLWLLPILDSQMKDAGFDIRDYKKIRSDLFGLTQTSDEQKQITAFENFLKKAHEKNINVIFDIAINHTSNEHKWFKESRKSPDNPYRNYYIWNKDNDRYKETRLLFEGMEPSNWEKDGNWYYFHRFFSFQPDLNYRNPDVLLEMSRNMVFWLQKGVDGFRADAIPYLWKEDGTDCENLPQNHIIVRFFRAALDYVRPNTLLLAEACQKPKEVVKYFGNGDECNAGYHFPLMPQIFKAIAKQSGKPIIYTLSKEVTPEIPESCQWFNFLRCHDELSLELVYVSEEDRKYIHEIYCKFPQWDFRIGQGISARLAELFSRDERKIGLAYSIMLTLPGTPVIYYGDEFGKTNDENYYKEMIEITGKDDTRFLVRGKIDWEKLNSDLNNKDSFSFKVFSRISQQIKTRKKYKSFGRGEIEWLELSDKNGKKLSEILAYFRILKNEKILIINNLSRKEKSILLTDETVIKNGKEILGQEMKIDGKTLILPAYGCCWILIT